MLYLKAPIPWIFPLGDSCQLHQLQIIMSGLLGGVDVIILVLCADDDLPSTKFFSLIATMSNTLREYSSLLKSLWIIHFNVTSRFAAKQPPRCLQQRWASTIKFLTFYLLRPFLQMREVLHQAFVVGAFCGAITAAGKPGAPVDEDGLLESPLYYERAGRWRASSLKISKSVALRAIMAAVHKVHLQIERMMSFSNLSNMSLVVGWN